MSSLDLATEPPDVWLLTLIGFEWMLGLIWFDHVSHEKLIQRFWAVSLFCMTASGTWFGSKLDSE